MKEKEKQNIFAVKKHCVLREVFYLQIMPRSPVYTYKLGKFEFLIGRKPFTTQQKISQSHNLSSIHVDDTIVMVSR